MYKYTTRVSYSESGPDARMKLSALVARMQDCTVFHSLSIGRGPVEWAKEESGWMILDWNILIDEMPICGEPVTTSTWAYSFSGFRGGRNFTFRDGSGKIFAKADSHWIFYDRKRKRPVKVPEAEVKGFGVEPPLKDFEKEPKRIPNPEGPCRTYEPIAVTQAYIDTNHHMNNRAYIELSLGYLPEGYPARALRIEYLWQVCYGDTLIPKTWETKDAFYISLENAEGITCALVQVVRKEGASPAV